MIPMLAGIALFAALVASAHAQSNSGTLYDPLSSTVSTIPALISTLLKALVEVALPILTLFIVYSGFLFVSARGKPDALKTARTNFTYVIIGAILILGAWELSNLLAGTVAQVTGGTGTSFQ